MRPTVEHKGLTLRCRW